MLQRLGVAGPRAEDVALVVSELVTNAVIHGPNAGVELRLEGTPTVLRVEVCDDGTARFDWPVDGSDSDGHWGLGLVTRFSERAGVEWRPCTTVWCEFDLAQIS
jgi:anti-sigma regulatory factor (Ser/Thr protein kinase)